MIKEYQYDSLGNVTLFRLTVDGGVRSTVAYEYDAMLRLNKVTELY